MAVHVPLALEAQTETHANVDKVIICSPATGEPIVTPSQDMVWDLII